MRKNDDKINRIFNNDKIMLNLSYINHLFVSFNDIFLEIVF